MAMSALAAQDTYESDENPWAGFMARDPPLPSHQPQRPLTRGEFVAGALGAIPGNIAKSTFGAAAAKLKPNPHPPGSEEAQDYEDRLRAQSYEFGPEVAQMMVGTGSFAGPKSVLGTGGSNIVQPIKAYHSSPYDFEKFDASKIGTGQGAASYGVGHYLAENPKVSGRGGEYWQEFSRRTSGSGEDMAIEHLAKAGFDRAKAAETVRELLANPPAYSSGYGKMTQERMLREALPLLESNKHLGARTYEVDIHARPEQFLDWDKPLAQQPHVTERIPRILDAAKEEAYNRALAATDRTRANTLWDMVKNPQQATGEFAFDKLGGRGPRRVETSNALREAGIPGIRYLDQGSRMHPHDIEYAQGMLKKVKPDMVPAWEAELARLQAKPTTSNFVVFPGNEHLLDIKKMYGLAGAVPTMGALAASDRYNE